MSNPRGRGRGGGDRGSGYGPRGGRGGRGQGGPGGYDSGGPSRGRGRGLPSGPVIYSPATPTRIDQRLASLDELITSFKKLDVGYERPLRPGYGNLGTKIILRTNFFSVTLPKGPIYEYDVKVSPTTDINRVKSRIFQLLELSSEFSPYAKHIAHDKSSRLVSAKKLPQPLSIRLPFREEGESAPRKDPKIYTVSITFTQILDPSNLARHLEAKADAREFNPVPLISALNLVLQTHASKTGVRVGKNRYFFPSEERMELGPRLDVRRGFYTSVRPTYNQLMVNVNVCMTAFYQPGNLADAIMEFQRRTHGGMPKKFVQKLKVITTHLGYVSRKPVKKIMDSTARDTKFDCPELGGVVSVEQYFKRKYKITLKHAHDLPLVDIGGQKTNYMPAELCEIDGDQPYSGRLSDKETSNMIEYASNRPKVNAETIMNDGLPALAFTREALGSPMKEFGLSVGTEMAVIPGRELPPPKLTYKSGPTNVSQGSWNILDVKFHRGATVKSWWLLIVRDGRDAISDQDPRLKMLAESFAAKCSRSGMTFPSGLPHLIFTQGLPPVNTDPSRLKAIDIIRQAIKGKASQGVEKPSFILVLLGGRDNYIYPGIKRIGEVELGVHTVHMLVPKVFKDANPKRLDQYLSNVALKVNTKLGGINHLLDQESMRWLTRKKTMVVGIDVTHPGPTSIPGTPSIAAVVASVDSSMVQFPVSMRLQESKKEMVTDLNEMIAERLLLFEKTNRQLPEWLIVYRDGVSEGQFDVVLGEELPQILDAFKRFNTKERGKPYRPTLSIVICGKRHHARFFPTDSLYADKNGNTRAGTVVDKGVTSVYEFDFYLQAHAGLQGTVRPTHYSVIYDESKLAADELQQGTNTASYLYGRATKAVSLVPAAYYADLACERGRMYINDFLNTGDDKSSVGAKRANLDVEKEKERVFSEAKARWGAGIHSALAESMFYI